jgi:hypothetical protein
MDQDDGSGGKRVYYKVEYQYGTNKSRGKSNFKNFHTEVHVKQGVTAPRTSLELATEFVTNKYYELWEKGYRDKESNSFAGETTTGTTVTTKTTRKGSRPINAVGETYYMEKKDPYNGDEEDECAFFQIKLLNFDVEEYPDDDDFDETFVYHIEMIEGVKGDVGYYEHVYVETLEEAFNFIEEQVVEKRHVGYRKKVTPKKIQARLKNPHRRDSDSGSDDDEDNDERRIKKQRIAEHEREQIAREADVKIKNQQRQEFHKIKNPLVAKFAEMEAWIKSR